MIGIRVARQGRLFGAVVAAGAAGLLLLKGLQTYGLVDTRALAAGVSLLLLAVVALSRPWWRALDEAEREAHKSAFYWGGMVAFALTGYLVISAGLGAHVTLARMAGLWLSPGQQAAGVAAGAFFAIVILVACYAVAWGVWWLRRR